MTRRFGGVASESEEREEWKQQRHKGLLCGSGPILGKLLSEEKPLT
jgi:hypothetical protein